MKGNYEFKNSTRALLSLLRDLGDQPVVPSRNGNTKELPFIGITLTEPWDRELLLLERKPNLAAQIAETMWVLAGRDDVEWLSNYLPRATDFSDDGVTWRGAYGPRLRNFAGGVDQLAYVVDLLLSNIADRRAVISIYDPVIDSAPGKDIPCNGWLHFLVREDKLDLHVAIRSNDAMWGWSGINAFEWSALQEIVASLVGTAIGQLHFSVSSFHLYEQHWGKAQRIVRAGGAPPSSGSPRFSPQFDGLPYFDRLVGDWFALEERIRAGEKPLRDIDEFPEPMLRSWLRVIAWWWTGDKGFLDATRLGQAAQLAVQPKRSPQGFVDYVDALHADKHQAYGDSWKRRGEMLGILANVARKIDRLGTNSADETSADTAVDLLVYLCKYRWWMVDEWDAVPPTLVSGHPDHVGLVKALLVDLEVETPSTRTATKDLEAKLTEQFELLEKADEGARVDLVDDMLPTAFELAQRLWSP